MTAAPATTAIVLGATGLVGRLLVGQLAEAGQVQRIVTLTRRPDPRASSKVFNHVVDFDHLSRSASLFEGTHFFSTLGTTRRQAGSIAAQRRVDFDYQLEAARLATQNGVGHYLLLSSSFADARSRNAYLKMKGELEQEAVALGFPRVSIFQPFVLTGERADRRPLEELGAFLFRAVSAIPGLKKYRPIPAAVVASKMIRVSQTAGPAREWFGPSEMFVVQDERKV